MPEATTRVIKAYIPNVRFFIPKPNILLKCELFMEKANCPQKKPQAAYHSGHGVHYYDGYRWILLDQKHGIRND